MINEHQMTIEAWATVVAVFLGPLIAVLITHFLQKSSEGKQRKLHVFRTLMATRKTPLSPERVQAINLVEIEFGRHPDVLNKFQNLLKTYNDQARWKSNDEFVRQKVIQDVDDNTTELLQAMGRVLGHKLDNLELLRGGYYPEAFNELERQQEEIREFMVGLKKGELQLPIAVVDVRHPEKLLQHAKEAQILVKQAESNEDDDK